MASPAALLPSLLPPLPDPRLAALPASARAVQAYLAARGPATHKDLVAGAGLPARTLRFALDRLRRAGLVEERASLRDARQTWYRLAEAPAGPPRGPRLGAW